jgi:site-specific DNA recombinase
MSDRRVAGYGRVSTQGQAADGTSSGEQKRIIQAECERNGWSLVSFYGDDGFSGKNDNRPGLQELIRAAKEKKFDGVMFTKLDRLGRNIRDIMNICHKLHEEHGLEIICVEQPQMNTKGPYGKLMLSLLAIFAEFERDIIRERTDNGRKSRWKTNKSIMGSLPFGYGFNDSKEICIKEEQAAIYHRIVSLYLGQRLSVMDIANRLIEEGATTPGRYGNRWNHVTVSKILQNEAYTGRKVYNRNKFELRTAKSSGSQYFARTKTPKDAGEWITVTYPPLISEDRFGEIQALMKSKVKRPKRKCSGIEGHFLLDKNLLYCGECGARMVKRVTAKGEFNYHCYWNISTEKERRMFGRAKCNFKTEADGLDRHVRMEIVDFLSNPYMFAKHWLKDLNLEETKQKLRQLETAKEVERKALDRLYDRLAVADEANAGLLQSKISEHEGKHTQIASELKKVRMEWDIAENKHDRLAEFERACAEALTPGEQMELDLEHQWSVKEYVYSLPFEDQKRIVEAVISPETGGRVTARYFVPMLDGDCEKGLPKEIENELWKPLMYESPILEVEFRADINRIEDLITGIDRRGLLDKFSPRCWRRSNGYQKRRCWSLADDAVDSTPRRAFLAC